MNVSFNITFPQTFWTHENSNLQCDFNFPLTQAMLQDSTRHSQFLQENLIQLDWLWKLKVLVKIT